jgi:hypothetical protein
LFQKQVLNFFKLRNLSFFELWPILSFFEPKPKKLPFSRHKKAQNGSKKLKTAQKNSKKFKKFELTNPCIELTTKGLEIKFFIPGILLLMRF